jgi:NAD(P)H-hydrate epimerase
LLKGPHTLIGAAGEHVLIGPASTPALATGGAGDVLTGVIAGFACAVEPFVAAWAGAFVHGLAAAAWSSELGADRGLLASEVADRIPRALAELSAET